MKIYYITKENTQLGEIYSVLSRVKKEENSYLILEYSKKIRELKKLDSIWQELERHSYRYKTPVEFELNSIERLYQYFSHNEFPGKSVSVLNSYEGFVVAINNLNLDDVSESKLVLTSIDSQGYSEINKHPYFKYAKYCSSKSDNIINCFLQSDKGNIYFLNSGLSKSEFELYKRMKQECPNRIRIVKNGIGNEGVYFSRDLLGVDLERFRDEDVYLNVSLSKNSLHCMDTHPYKIGGSPSPENIRKKYGKKILVVMDKPVFNEEIEAYICKEYGCDYSDEKWVAFVQDLISTYKDKGYKVLIKLHPYSSKDAEGRFSNITYSNRNLNLRYSFKVADVVIGWGSKELVYAMNEGCKVYSYISNAHLPKKYISLDGQVCGDKYFEDLVCEKLIRRSYKRIPIKMNVRMIENYQRTCEVVCE